MSSKWEIPRYSFFKLHGNIHKMERTRKLMTMYKALYSSDDIERLFMLKKEGWRGLLWIKDYVDALIHGFKDCINNHKERLIIWTNRTVTKIRKQKWEEKLLRTGEISYRKTWTWLRNRNLWSKSESLQIAAQNKVIRTNYIKAKIDNMQQNSKCTLCWYKDERLIT